jgi:hypothetical protein
MTLLFKSIDGKTYTLANVRGPKGTLIVAVLGVTPPRWGIVCLNATRCA